jgi:hypothetical protein
MRFSPSYLSRHLGHFISLQCGTSRKSSNIMFVLIMKEGWASTRGQTQDIGTAHLFIKIALNESSIIPVYNKGIRNIISMVKFDNSEPRYLPAASATSSGISKLA